MNGAESLITTLVNNGVEVCFCNPGTSEMHFVGALDEVEGMRAILCLFEGVLSGAADGYARMAGKPASTLLHLGPGLGNALANTHNAKKGNVPVINIVGDHATYHLKYDAPLTSDIESIAGAVSHWVHTSQAPGDIAKDAAEAVRQAGIGKVASLMLPADVSWSDNPNGAEDAVEKPQAATVSAAKLDEAVAKIRASKNCMIMIGGREISAQRGIALSKIGKAAGVKVCTDVFPGRVARGAGTAQIDRLPYLAAMGVDYLKDIDCLILIGAAKPVAFFAYPNTPSAIAPASCEQFMLAGANDDIDQVLDHLLGSLDASDVKPDLYPLQLPAKPSGALDASSVAQALAHFLPENAIVVDEAITTSMTIGPATLTARPHDWLNLTGGSIGWGLPGAVGAAVACPDRKVVCLEGDGSAMYTIQALWTMARENLDVLVVIFNNRKYSILEMEFAQTGARDGTPGPKAGSALDIGAPDMDFAAMAQGMGVSASRATSAEEFNAQLETAMAKRGPHLIDAIIPTLF
jgi:acetolactate synthase-1/2/3 large subunit